MSHGLPAKLKIIRKTVKIYKEMKDKYYFKKIRAIRKARLEAIVRSFVIERELERELSLLNIKVSL